MIAAAVVTGVGRVISEEHHASDLLVGYGVGVLAGFIMPEFLHYRLKSPSLADEPSAASTTLVRTTLVPQIGPRDLGVGLRRVSTACSERSPTPLGDMTQGLARA